MFTQIFNVLQQIIEDLVHGTINIINNIVENNTGLYLDDYPIKIVLFSDTPIWQNDLQSLLVIFFTIFYSMFFIVLLYKVTKKIIKKVFGVIRL